MLQQTLQNDAASRVSKFSVLVSDGLFRAVERALDNGTGTVFVVNEEGAAVGTLTLDHMRELVLAGRHLDPVSAGQIMTPGVDSVADASTQTVPVSAVLGKDGSLQDVVLRGDHAFVPVAEPDLGHGELRNVMDAVMSTWISSTGDYIRTFERRFAQRTQTAHGIATSNGTVSLHLALVALGIGEGDEVIVPDLTFAASINTVLHTGARPVIVDVDPDTWVITPEAIEAAITPRTRAVMPVHVFGRPAPMTEIMEVARRRGLYVLEDCAEAHDATYDGKPVGSFGDISSFSFFANKIMTTGEGGICVTNSSELADRMKMLRDHGMRPERRYWHEEAGFNYRMTNMQAAIGCAQIDRLDDFLAERRRVHDLYSEVLKGIPGVSMPPPLSDRFGPVIWFACATVPAEKRAQLIQACKAIDVDLRPFFNCLSVMPPYRPYARPCPNAYHLSQSGVNLPTSRRVDERLARRIADVFRGHLS
jgi:perosamine synthetase